MLLSRSGCNPGPTHSGTQIWLRSHRKQGGSYSSVIQPHTYRTSPDPACHLLLPPLDTFLQINLQSSTIHQILTQSENRGWVPFVPQTSTTGIITQSVCSSSRNANPTARLPPPTTPTSLHLSPHNPANPHAVLNLP